MLGNELLLIFKREQEINKKLLKELYNDINRQTSEDIKLLILKPDSKFERDTNKKYIDVSMSRTFNLILLSIVQLITKAAYVPAATYMTETVPYIRRQLSRGDYNTDLCIFAIRHYIEKSSNEGITVSIYPEAAIKKSIEYLVDEVLESADFLKKHTNNSNRKVMLDYFDSMDDLRTLILNMLYSIVLEHMSNIKEKIKENNTSNLLLINNELYVVITDKDDINEKGTMYEWVDKQVKDTYIFNVLAKVKALKGFRGFKLRRKLKEINNEYIMSNVKYFTKGDSDFFKWKLLEECLEYSFEEYSHAANSEFNDILYVMHELYLYTKDSIDNNAIPNTFKGILPRFKTIERYILNVQGESFNFSKFIKRGLDLETVIYYMERTAKKCKKKNSHLY